MAATLEDLAQLAGVSKTTVSLVLNGRCEGRVSQATREQILRLTRKYGYRTNVAARGLRQRKAFRIGICIHGSLGSHAVMGEFSFYDRLGLLARQTHAAGYALELIEIDPAKSAVAISRELSQKDVDGFVFLSWKQDILERLLFSLEEENIPAVACGRPLAGDEFTWASVDRGKAIDDAVTLLVRDGRRKIAFLEVRHEGDQLCGGAKRQGFLSAARRELGTDGTTRIFTTHRLDAAGVFSTAMRLLRTMTDVNAVVLSDNQSADILLLALEQRGIKPGADCRIIGLGDTWLADRCDPKVSHYSLHTAEQVKFILEALTENINSSSAWKHRYLLIRSQFIKRET